MATQRRESGYIVDIVEVAGNGILKAVGQDVDLRQKSEQTTVKPETI